MRCAWTTDVHLNFAADDSVARLSSQIAAAGAELLLVGGDIGEADCLDVFLKSLETHLCRPIYFVLGNHDYYGSGIASVSARMKNLNSKWLHWLPADGIVALAPGIALVGEGGWGDARCGDFGEAAELLDDYRRIEELRKACGTNEAGSSMASVDKESLRRVLNQLGDNAAALVEPLLAHAAQSVKRVVFLTHVPPFAEACWRRGRTASRSELATSVCGAVGDALRRIAASRPLCEFIVLCGHTHSAGRAQILPNLVAYTQGAQYGRPDFLLLEADERDLGLSR